MCFSCSLSVNAQALANRYQAPTVEFSGGAGISAFAHPKLPVVAQEGELRIMHWGLVPSWVKKRDQANDIRKKTLNARSETVFEKPSFRDAVKHHRCLIPVTSFQEWHHNSDGSKQKYDIRIKDEEIYSLAGIWSEWKGPESGVSYFSYSILTCEANELMAKIHNTKKRMPVILTRAIENEWIRSDISREELQELMVPYHNELMIAEKM